ncbi:TIGR02302 family protein [Methylobacterium sp. M6A4_1b]
MGEADPATSTRSGQASDSHATAPETRGPALRRRLDRLVARSQVAGLWERAWPILWRGIGLVLAFLTLSWLGLWLDLPPLARVAGIALFALALVAVLLPLARLRRDTRREALARIDRAAAARGGPLSHNPASSIEDTLAVGTADPATRALWALHQARAAEAVAGLTPPPPRPAMARRDPFAFRAGLIVAAVASLFVAGAEWRPRILGAFDWRAPPAPGPTFRVDGWIDPPLYTRLPPLVVTMNGEQQRLRAPVNSTLIVRIAGQGEAVLTPKAGLKALPGKPPHADLREDRFQLTGGVADLTVAAGGTTQHLVVETIPDTPPEVERIGALEVNARGTFNLTYRAKDDYGIASAEGLVEPLAKTRALVPTPKIALALPTDATGEHDTKTLVDLTDNPWSGARVRLTLVVKDEAGQEGRTPTAEVTLPARVFAQPLARALAEERRRLITAPDDGRARVQTALDALLIAPDRFTPQPSIFLGLKTASRRLRAARSDEALMDVADLLWEMALKIEDGDLSDAEKSLRAAQDNLKQAIERNAPDEEIKKLTEDLKQALDKFMKGMAERQRKDQKPQAEKSQPNPNAKTVTPDDLTKMLNDMAEAMKRGDTAEAQRLLDQLREILENLQTAEPGGKSDPNGREMSKQADELDKLSREQQDLRDETFKDGQDKRGQRPQRGQQGQPGEGQKGQPGQQGQGQQGQGQQGEGQQGQGQQGQKGEGQKGGAGQRQQALRERLEDLQRRMKDLGMQGEEGLSEAEEAMREAEGALGQGKDGEAVDAQGRALDGLKRGAEGMQKQMQEMAEGEGEGKGEGGEQPSQQGQAGNRDDDPLGRPTKGRDMTNGNARVPTADESAVQRTRRIMEELRRKLGDPNRPRDELDYFERLLRRN